MNGEAPGMAAQLSRHDLPAGLGCEFSAAGSTDGADVVLTYRLTNSAETAFGGLRLLVLLDAEMDHPVVEEIREAIAAQAEWGREAQITDLHVWRVGKGSYACILALSSPNPGLTIQSVRQCLSVHEEIVHLTVEIQ